MIMLLSPAKRIDETPVALANYSFPLFQEECLKLVNVLRQFDVEDFESLMKVSTSIAGLNRNRFQEFSENFTIQNAKPAVLTFDGDAYNGMENKTLDEKDLAYLQEHLGILSGLYGFLRPLDLIKAYRLEMGTKLAVQEYKNLYAFWGNKITTYLNSLDHDVIVNLASKEYFKVIQPKALKALLVNVEFKEWRGDKFKVIAFNAKKARGMMCRFAVENEITDAEQFKLFDKDDYTFNTELSTENNWVFTRA
jgi:uncharacterized protein